MKFKIFIAVLLVAGAWVAGRSYWRGQSGEEQILAAASPAAPAPAGEATGPGLQQIDESYRLSPGARVEVSGINGPVEIVTAEGDAAEVHAETRADDGRTLERQKITVEHAADRLVVRGGKPGGGGFLSWLGGRKGGRAKHSVRLLLPRRVTLDANGINGRLRVGELEGGLEVSGVSGAVEVGSAAGGSEVSGVNGPVSLSLASVGAGGVQVSGINGPVDLRLAATVNADIDAVGINGPVVNELTRAAGGGQGGAPFSARVGAGGPHINLSGINGGLTLSDK